jgi:hypothetical protein
VLAGVVMVVVSSGNAGGAEGYFTTLQQMQM